MKEELLARIREETADWAYMKELPEEYCGFRLSRLEEVQGDKYLLFTYANEPAHRAVKTYYHEETFEYKLLICVGSFDFCYMDCMMPSMTDST